jgi:Arc/MetJ family transcription regulator
MSRTLVDVDPDLLAASSTVLGTPTKKDTVTAAVSAPLAAGRTLCTCPLVDLKLLHSARGPAE